MSVDDFVPRLTLERVERFWRYVDQRGPDECWPWTRARPRGYGVWQIKFDGRPIYFRAHRLALILSGGKPPTPTSFALHSCDNPPCCNPAHLRWGTPRDNSQDMVSRGRHPSWTHADRLRRGPRPAEDMLYGDDHPNMRITDEQVREIKVRYANGGVSQRALAREYGVTQGAISHIITGRNRSREAAS